MDLWPLSFEPASADNEVSTAQTIGLMRQYSDAAVYHQPVIDATRAALCGIPDASPAWRKAQAIHEWIRQHIRFVTDESILATMGLPEDMELLIAPYLLLQYGRGDCDDFTMLGRAMLQCAGLPADMVTIAADRRDPGRWSHVYAETYDESGQAIPFDSSHGQYAGWEAPQYFRREVWPA